MKADLRKLVCLNQRKSEIEYKQQLGSFTIPTCNTLNELLKEYVSLYGKTKWAINGYSSNTGLIRHYIAPKLGELRLKEITPRVLEMFYQGLLKTPAVPLMVGADRSYWAIPIMGPPDRT